ncbi:hypothetical protein AB0I94_21575 [Streptomyces sp. NPDC050147]|uniref:hypothetical protein n=1 Tax=Streptomyces sp. NPDC050147 TaxID=3155513 RepID=UPI00342E5A28
MNRRTMHATAALAATAALLLTACSSGGGDGSDGDKGSKSGDSGKAAADSSTPPAKKKRAKSAAQLALAKTEVPGHAVVEPSDDFVFAKSQDNIKLSKPVCAPLGHAMSQFPVGDAQDSYVRVAEMKEFNGAFTYITLATYAPGEAQSTMAAMTKAVSACAGGFTAKGDKASNVYDSVTSETTGTAPTPGADESLAFRATTKYQGDTHTVRTQATRHGDTIAVYFAMDGSAFVQSRSGNGKIFPAVVKSQEKKLG